MGFLPFSGPAVAVAGRALLQPKEGGEQAVCPPPPLLLGVEGPSSLVRVPCPWEYLQLHTPGSPQGGQTWFLPLQTGSAEAGTGHLVRTERLPVG